MLDLDHIRERALINFELLLDLWNISHKKVTEQEYDLIATWRADANYGSVRFNIEKGRGADFAGGSLTEEDFASFGLGFSKQDFDGYSLEEGQTKIGFDVIGLYQRISNTGNYKLAAVKLNSDLDKISSARKFKEATPEAYLYRKKQQEIEAKKRQRYAKDLWESAKCHNIEGSPGEKYLISRHINIKDPNIRYHPGIKCKEDNTKRPALLFKIQKDPRCSIEAVHRIFLTEDGTKAKLLSPKMALASVKGCGIWFGIPSNRLAIAEGPEEALTLKIGYDFDFTVSTIFATNFHNLTIPKCVEDVVLFPDIGEAGLKALERAMMTYTNDPTVKVTARVNNSQSLDLNDTWVRMNNE